MKTYVIAAVRDENTMTVFCKNGKCNWATIGEFTGGNWEWDDGHMNYGVWAISLIIGIPADEMLNRLASGEEFAFQVGEVK